MAHTAPDPATVQALVDRGLTPAEIAVELNLPRAVIESLLARHAAPRFPRPHSPGSGFATLPWDLSPAHEQDENALMLHLERRRRMGEALTQGELDSLTDWRNRLLDADSVVDYSPESGFEWAARVEGDRDIMRFRRVA